MRLIVAAIFAIAVSCPALAQQGDRSAPFGLTWGMALEDVKTLHDVIVRDLKTTDGSIAVIAAALPKTLDDTEAVQLNFGFNNKLWRIVAVGKSVTNDPYGSKIKVRYDELAEVLKQKYGSARQHHFAKEGFYSRPDNFVYGIHEGEIWHYSDFETPQLAVQLGIRSAQMNEAHYVLYYEYLPLTKDYDKGATAKQKDTL